MFISLLYKNNIEIKKIKFNKDLINDLLIDNIVDSILYNDKYKYLRETFFEPTYDIEVIEYRNKIFIDIVNFKIKEILNKFSDNLEESYELFSFSKTIFYEIFKHGYLFKSILIYCKSIIEFNNYFQEFNFTSEGLNKLKTYINNYVNSEFFRSLYRESIELEEEINKIKFILVIDYGKITVKKFKEQKSFKDELLNTFNKFINLNLIKEESLNFNENLLKNFGVNHIESNILKLVSKIYPKTFQKLKLFYEKYLSFHDINILKIAKEIKFYILYLNFIDKFKSYNLFFSIPKINKNSKVEEVINSFDINLAINLMKINKKVITNSYVIKDNKNTILITGPNSSGKTTFARMFGQIHYLACLGVPVPGEFVNIFIPDSIFTHFEKQENILENKSKFEVDLHRFKNIFDSLTDKSIIILNEIFSSTSIFDAEKIINIILNRFININCLSVWVSFIDQPFRNNKFVISLVSQINKENPEIKLYKIIEKEPEVKAYALNIAKKYNLTFDEIIKRIENKL